MRRSNKGQNCFLVADCAWRIKNTIVDKVDEIEIPLGHVIPKMFSGMLLPIAVFIYL
jgi:hypothetical protein